MNKKTYGLIAALVLGWGVAMAQNEARAVAAATTETTADVTTETAAVVTTDTVTAGDSTAVAVEEIPLWKQKLYYGYNFDIYFHHDTRNGNKENGWSIAFTPEIGWRLRERIYLGLRFGGSYQDTYSTINIDLPTGGQTTTDLRIRQGSWEVAPYIRYRMKTMFNGKIGIWMETHLYTGMEFPSVVAGSAYGTNYDGLKHSIIYGFQISPVVTYQFSRNRTFQVFFSILSIGYSGTTFCYVDPTTSMRYNEYTNDVIIFSGKLRNLIANQFTPGLYGLKFGIQKSF